MERLRDDPRLQGISKLKILGVGRPLYFRILNFEFQHRTLFIPLFLNLFPLGPKPLEEGSADPHLGCSAAQLRSYII